MKIQEKLRYLQDRWDQRAARFTRCGRAIAIPIESAGSGSAHHQFWRREYQFEDFEPDLLDGTAKTVLWIKGSGGDIGGIERKGFATLYLDKLLALRGRYRGVETEDQMVEMYPLCAFGNNTVAASIDTPLHAFLPYAHVDHLHRTGASRWRRPRMAGKNGGI